MYRDELGFGDWLAADAFGFDNRSFHSYADSATEVSRVRLQGEATQEIARDTGLDLHCSISTHILQFVGAEIL